LALAAIGGALAAASRNPEWIRRRLANWADLLAAFAALFQRPRPLPAEWPELTADQLAQAARDLAERRNSMIPLVATSLGAQLASVIALGALGLCFASPVPPLALLAVFVLGQMVWIFSPVPQGIGAVEGTLAITLASMGVPADRATLIAVCFRGLTFWAPMIVGLFLLRRLRALGAR
jgi:uncharacterized membrane protein YbhN (UPF0104 family)